MDKEIVKIYIMNHPYIRALFSDGVTKEYNVTKYGPEYPDYEKLNEPSFFEKAKLLSHCTIYFSDEVDIDSNTVYLDGKTVESEEKAFQIIMGYELKQARLSKFLSQDQLSKLTGIKQGDISKLEKGLMNPSIKTIKRITDALGKKLTISITPKIKY